jgi:hypothetical protein
MSKVSITGNASGTGTFTLAAPDSNSDRTLTLPDNTGTIITTGSTFAGTGPAFSAYLGTAQTFSAATWTKANINTEDFDTNSCFDTSLYRFTPNVAGYYQVNFCVTINNASSNAPYGGGGQIYKNGAATNINSQNTTSNVELWLNKPGSGMIYLNGTTDYIELYAYINGTTGPRIDTDTTRFSAFLARAA